MAIESIRGVQALYRNDAIVSEIPPDKALEAGRFLVDAGFTTPYSYAQASETITPQPPELTAAEAGLLEDPEVEVAVIIRAGRLIVGGTRVKEVSEGAELAPIHPDILEDPNVEAAVVISDDLLAIGGTRVEEPTADVEPVEVRFAPLRVSDMLNQLGLVMVDDHVVDTRDIRSMDRAKRAAEKRLVAGPYIKPLPDGRLSSMVGIMVWERPIASPDSPD